MEIMGVFNFKLIFAKLLFCPKTYLQNKLFFKKLLEALLNIFSVAKSNIEIELFSKSLFKTVAKSWYFSI